MNRSTKQSSLIVLAGGMGSRFGGLKQLFQLGSKRQTIFEYTLDDAQELGIKKVIFVIRKAIEHEFREQILNKLFRRPLEIKLVFQELSALPEGLTPHPDRTKPWGTGQALMLGYQACKTPGAIVVSGNYYYGKQALKAALEAASWARNTVIGYPVEKTLSRYGPVCRALLKTTPTMGLEKVEICHSLTKVNIPKGALANMNLLTLAPSIKSALEENWQNFCKDGGTQTLDRECLLPSALHEAVRQGISVEVIPTHDTWVGLTHKEDIADVELRIGRNSISNT